MSIPQIPVPGSLLKESCDLDQQNTLGELNQIMVAGLLVCVLLLL
jgi:hypothetical protein